MKTDIQAQMKGENPDEVLADIEAKRGLAASVGSVPVVWTYSSYSASLRKNGRFFAIVTPDGKNRLSPEAAIELVETLTRGSANPAPNDRGER